MFSSPAWLGWSLAGLFTVLAIFSLIQVLAPATRSWAACCDGVTGDRESALAHSVMAVAMALMFVPWGNSVPAIARNAVFVAMAAWFAATLFRAAPGLPRWRSAATHHLLGAVAMLAMVSAMGGAPAASGDHGGHSSASAGFLLPAVMAGLVVYFAADVALSGWRAVRGGPVGRGSGAARAVMGAGMTVMLVPML
ncbi:DUF5134 domain-containing protein [Amycolatopsis methanolica]|uniref:Uncharacterized protein n=1 Tax=Amycolatopsis methanolica 239 TaxID=1068978 RepID=A0A076N1Z7_AMYME|nr:DUF5134 domain-containing protein [Amycolatopsis methanolica]AIJ25126.1 hypothetical protein AMETH_5034 [Amycolatopsis methanolica 239]